MASNTVNVRMTADVGNYDANIAKARRQLEGFKKDNLSMGGVMKQLSGSFVGLASRFIGVGAAIGAFGAAIKGSIETAKGFERSMSQLSSLTGKTGRDLEQLKDYAIELGSKTTLSASQVADAFKMIGSQQPQLLSSASALKEVTQYAIQLSEAAGIELSTAAQTLSTSINQMGGDSSNAARYVNVLAAASQQGAGDIAWLGEAITKSATAAKAVGTDYEELVANLEQLAKAGFDASTAGTALRSIIMNLEKQSNQQFKPSVVGLTEAFSNLGKANLDLTAYQELTGKMFATQAKVLAEASGAAREMTTSITGTNTAEEQARINTDNLDGSLKSLASAWEGLNLHINSSNGLLKTAVDWLKDVVTWADQAFTSAGKLQKAFEGMGGSGKVQGMIGDLSGSSDKNSTYARQMMSFSTQIRNLQAQIGNGGKLPGAGSGEVMDVRYLQTQLDALRKMRDEYEAMAKTILNPTTATPATGGSTGTTANTATPGKVDKVPVAGSIDAMREYIKGLQDAFNQAADQGLRDALIPQLEYAEKVLERMQGKFDRSNIFRDGGGSLTDRLGLGFNADKLDNIKLQPVETGGRRQEMTMMQRYDKAVGGFSSIAGGMKQLGIELPKGFETLLGGLQGLSTIVSGVTSVIEAFSVGSQAANTVALTANTVALGALTSAVATNTAFSFIPFFANGGVVHAAGGLNVPGNHFSGDMVPALVNSGETILTMAQSAVVAEALSQRSMGTSPTSSVLRGEEIIFAVNNTLRRMGMGEMATTRGRR